MPVNTRLNLGIFFVLGLRPRTKKFLGFGAIYRHIALQNPIYTLHIHHLLVVYICICPELGAISHIFSHIRPELGAKSTYICIYTPRVRDYIQQYSPEFGIYVFLTAMLEFPLNLSHFDCYFLMKNTNSTIVITPPMKTQTNKVQ